MQEPQELELWRYLRSQRELSARLYGGDRETRVQQEIILGIGGVRVLKAMGSDPGVYHLNEGHAAFVVLQRIRDLCESGWTFEAALEQVLRSEHNHFAKLWDGAPHAQRLVLLALAIIALPMMAALVIAAVQLRQLGAASERIVAEGMAATRVTQRLAAQQALLEGQSRRYLVLENPDVLQPYLGTDLLTGPTIGAGARG